MRGVVSFLTACFVLAASSSPASAESLADVRQDLGALLTELRGLEAELDRTQPAGHLGHASILDKISSIEFELKRLTRTTERLEFRIEQVVRDGTRRIGDIEFRVCELEPDCVFDGVGGTLPLGGVPKSDGSITPTPPPIMVTVTERSDFNTAKTAFENGDIETAVQLLDEFLETYPGGPMAQPALMLLGAAQRELGNHKDSARAFLESYSFDPTSNWAGDGLLNLAMALKSLGQIEPACVTLSEVIMKFPETALADDALAMRSELACS